MTEKNDIYEAIHTHDTTWAALMEASFDPIVLADHEGRINRKNEAFKRFMEGSTSLGQPVFNIFSDPGLVEANFSAIKEGYSPAPLVCGVLGKDGRHIESEIRICSYKDKEGRSFGVFTFRDLATKKRSEEQTAHLAAIVTSSNDAIISTSMDGIIKVWNTSAENIFGYNSTEAVGKPISLIIPAELLEDELQVIDRIQNGELLSQFETLRKRKDGRIINVSISASPIKDQAGSIIGMSKVLREITDQKKFEKELLEAKRNAERDKQRAEEAMKAKQQFLSTMSHEIRTPLNAIIGFTKVVLKTNLNEKQREYLNAIKISGDALIVLINDILDLSKVEAGKMVFEDIPFRLEECLTDTLRMFETKVFKRKIALIQDIDPRIPGTISGDAVRLKQILLNLVGNAVKFTSQGKITVRVKMLHEEEEHVRVLFEVCDTGIGIADNEIESIFDNFQQAATHTARLYGGTGLGLAIVKQLVLSQNGTISVSSKLGEGSTFSFSLDFKKTPDQIQPEEEVHFQAETHDDKVKILVAEDVTLNQLLIKTLIRSFGYEITIVPNGKAATEKLMQEAYDLVLMDLQMPVMSGYEATEYIRNTMKLNIPIIALTADVTTADEEKCKAIGMNDYIPKPIDEKLLYAKISRFIHKPVESAPEILPEEKEEAEIQERFIDMDYLKQKTSGDQEMMREMIRSYLSETPRLINAMKESINNMDWKALSESAHAIIPSFSIMGFDPQFEAMARKVKDHAAKKEESLLVNSLVSNIEDACIQAIKQLERELTRL